MHPYQPHVDYVRFDRLFPINSEYAAKIPAIEATERIDLHPHVTFFIGENGTGKSTLLEAIAVADGFNPEGGTRNFSNTTKDTHADLYKWIKLGRGARGKRRSDGFFLRAESFYNVATEIDERGLGDIYGDSYHEQSHGESFLSLVTNRLRGDGLYLLDEPEAALSPQRQLAFLIAMHELVERESQLIIATHSPLIMAYPNAWIYQLTDTGLQRIEYQDTEHYRVTRNFLENPERSLGHLLGDGE